MVKKSIEYCPNCNQWIEITVPAESNRHKRAVDALCPICKKRILPCEYCGADGSDCDYDGKKCFQTNNKVLGKCP